MCHYLPMDTSFRGSLTPQGPPVPLLPYALFFLGSVAVALWTQMEMIGVTAQPHSPERPDEEHA